MRLRRKRSAYGLRRFDATVEVGALTPRQVRATVRAIDLVVDVLRPHLFEVPEGQRRAAPPVLLEVRQVLTAAAERAGVNLEDPWRQEMAQR